MERLARRTAARAARLGHALTVYSWVGGWGAGRAVCGRSADGGGELRGIGECEEGGGAP